MPSLCQAMKSWGCGMLLPTMTKTSAHGVNSSAICCHLLRGSSSSLLLVLFSPFTPVGQVRKVEWGCQPTQRAFMYVQSCLSDPHAQPLIRTVTWEVRPPSTHRQSLVHSRRPAINKEPHLHTLTGTQCSRPSHLQGPHIHIDSMDPQRVWLTLMHTELLHRLSDPSFISITLDLKVALPWLASWMLMPRTTSKGTQQGEQQNQRITIQSLYGLTLTWHYCFKSEAELNREIDLLSCNHAWKRDPWLLRPV